MTLMSSSSDLSGCIKALCPSTYCTKVLSPAIDLISMQTFTSLMTKYCRIFIASNFMEGRVLFTSLES